jgi:hypothetical protein
VTCELVCAIDRSHEPPITTIVVAPADDGTLLAVYAQLQARDRSGSACSTGCTPAIST